MNARAEVRQFARVVAAVLAAITLAGPRAGAQTPGNQPAPAAVARRYFPPHLVHSDVRPVSAALGARVRSPGKEQIVVAGTLTKGANRSTLRVIRELPGKVRIEETGGKGRVLAYDLANLSSG